MNITHIPVSVKQNQKQVNISKLMKKLKIWKFLKEKTCDIIMQGLFQHCPSCLVKMYINSSTLPVDTKF